MDGVLLVTKPQGWTSHDVVQHVRKTWKLKSVGHAGTLDPIAEGLLVILLGEATKLSDHLLSQDKEYWVRVQFGVESDTLDADGEIKPSGPAHGLSQEEFENLKAKLVGELELPVPQFSSVKIQGKKLYEYARSGETVVLPQRTMIFRHVEMRTAGNPSEFLISCQSGTYIRSWVQHLGKLLNTGAIVQNLKRLKSGIYSVESAITVDDLGHPEKVKESYIPLSELLENWPTIAVSGQEEVLFRNGQVPHRIKRALYHEREYQGRNLRVIGADRRLLCLLYPDKDVHRIGRVFKSTRAQISLDDLTS